MPSPFDKPGLPKNPYAIPVGNGVGYPDMNGLIHSTIQGAVDANQGIEGSASRGASGACPQDSNNIPPHSPWSDK